MIMGLVIACVMIFVYACLYFHDKAILEGAAQMAAQRGRLLITENQRPENGETDWDLFSEKGLLWRMTGVKKDDEICQYAADLTEGRLLVCEAPVFTVEAGNSVRIKYSARTKLKGVYPLGSLMVIPAISGSVKDSGTEPEEFVRLIKALLAEED